MPGQAGERGAGNAPNLAVSVRGRARVVRERMVADQGYALVEVQVEQVKDDLTAAICVASAVTMSIREAHQDWFQALLSEEEDFEG